MFTLKEIREKMHGASEVRQSIIDQIHHERLLQIWVPKRYGGLGLRLKEGLQLLFDWSKIDGSLGWMLTLCSGANFFSRNLKPNIAKELFSNSKTCFGGSGMIGGTAEKQSNGTFLINGLWHFATGAPHLSYFTLNAKLTENENPLLDESGNELIRSFVISKNQTEIIPNWKSMGLKATGTYSFKVDNEKLITAGIVIGTFSIFYFFLTNFTDSDVPILDSLVSAFAWAGMWLMARRKIENWILQMML
jgi:indole-3-acetate monooxygenase